MLLLVSTTDTQTTMLMLLEIVHMGYLIVQVLGVGTLGVAVVRPLDDPSNGVAHANRHMVRSPSVVGMAKKSLKREAMDEVAIIVPLVVLMLLEAVLRSLELAFMEENGCYGVFVVVLPVKRAEMDRSKVMSLNNMDVLIMPIRFVTDETNVEDLDYGYIAVELVARLAITLLRAVAVLCCYVIRVTPILV